MFYGLNFKFSIVINILYLFYSLFSECINEDDNNNNSGNS